MTRLRVKNWNEFQHYRDRRPPWIKLHRSLLDDFAWHRLPDASRALAPMLWLLASESAGGVIPYDPETIAFRVHTTRDKVDAAIAPLIAAGFLIEEPLAARARGMPTKVPEDFEQAARARGGNRATPIPESWQASVVDLAWAAKARPDLTPALLAAETERFRNHAIGNNRLAHDWGHLWRHWLMKARLDAPAAGQPNGKGHVPEHRPSVRMGGPDGPWKLRLTGYRPGDPWKYEGDPPGGSNCKVPTELISHWRAYLRELEAVR